MFEMILLFLLLLVFSLLDLIWVLYQSIRNESVYWTRMRWIDKRDERYDRYSYASMFNPSRKNWFGLKYPKDEDFK